MEVPKCAKNELLDKAQLCGRLTHAYAQWNRGVTVPIGFMVMPETERLIQASGYADVFQFSNWRGYKKYSSGPCSQLGGYGVDVLNWFLDTPPKSVSATGGAEYYVNVEREGKPSFTFENLDNLISIYDYDVPGNGLVRAVSQVITTNSSDLRYEKFMGDKGTMTLGEEHQSIGSDSENPYNRVYREPLDTDLTKWRGLVSNGILNRRLERVHHKFWEREKTWHERPKWLELPDPQSGLIQVYESEPLDEFVIDPNWYGLNHMPHIENFLLTIHTGGGQSDLNCPAEAAYETTVAVLKAVELAENGGGKYDFRPSDFQVS